MRAFGDVVLVNAEGIYPKPPEPLLPCVFEKVEKVLTYSISLTVKEYRVTVAR
jgi:hypothetical protein